MSCGSVQTGNHFLGAVLAQIDCQAQSIGAYGYGALAAPGSAVSSLLVAALTLSIAVFGLRMMFGGVQDGRDVTGELLRIAIVLTLATSWPAWRTLAYDTVLGGPTEIAASVGLASGLPGSNGSLTARLDNADQGIVALTAFGSGRLTGGVVGSSDLGDSTRGIALADQSGFAWGRVAFLIGTIGPIAVVKLGAGFLLALAPLMAGLLLFAGTRDLFFGWLRALGACAAGSLALALTYSTQLAMLEGWLRDAQTQRAANALTPAVPTELLVFGIAFAVIAVGILTLVMRLCFFVSSGTFSISQLIQRVGGFASKEQPAFGNTNQTSTSEIHRAQLISDSVARIVRSEERGDTGYRVSQIGEGSMRREAAPSPAEQVQSSQALGSSYRRYRQRLSSSGTIRDART